MQSANWFNKIKVNEMHHCRAEVVDGQVQVVGPSAAGQNADGSAAQEPSKEDFEVPSQLRQQFIEVHDFY